LSVISNVMFPALSSIKEEQVRVRSIYLRAIGLVSMLTFPIMVGLFVVAEPFVLAVYGDKWSDMIPLLQILTPVGAIQSMINPTGWLYMSQGRTDWQFRWGVARSSVLVLAIAAGILLGSVEMVAICYAVANVLLLYPDIVIPGRSVQMGFGQVLRAVLGPFASSVAMGVVVYGFSLLLPTKWLAWQRLAILVAVGMVVYCGLVIGLRLSPWLEFVAMVRQRIGKQSKSDYMHTSLP
jgi:O-antigen/teichoic acid export membrane protein